jgi:hypothetical protein
MKTLVIAINVLTIATSVAALVFASLETRDNKRKALVIAISFLTLVVSLAFTAVLRY